MPLGGDGGIQKDRQLTPQIEFVSDMQNGVKHYVA